MQAAKFADELTDLLNKTVCHGVRLTAVISDPSRVVVGYKITSRDLVVKQGMPLCLGRGAPTAYLNAFFRLDMDHEGRYLRVLVSVLGLYEDPELDRALIHYDYEREKGDGYPEAHLHVCARPESWDTICARSRGDNRSFDRLHLPVGGRRYRPTLEDLLEFVITEKIAQPRPGAMQEITKSRRAFERRQLRAAVRRDPQAALDILTEMGQLDQPGAPGRDAGKP